MFYYLQDHASAIIISISQNPYVIKNLKSGLLDCTIFSFDSHNSTVDTLLKHFDQDSNEGIKLLKSGLIKLDLQQYPEVKNKIFLAKIRTKAFDLLLRKAKIYRLTNSYGFHASDPFVIAKALSDQNRIDEYAQVIGLDTFMARQELEMISNSIQIDLFRIFTISQLWKKHINQTSTIDDIEKIINNIELSFFSPGIPNV
jgi:hypothetical protein